MGRLGLGVYSRHRTASGNHHRVLVLEPLANPLQIELALHGEFPQPNSGLAQDLTARTREPTREQQNLRNLSRELGFAAPWFPTRGLGRHGWFQGKLKSD